MRQMIMATTDNERMKTILVTMNDQIETARHYSSAPPGRIQELLSDFLSVVKALRVRNSVRAQRLLQAHLSKSKKVLLEMFGSPASAGNRREVDG
jgi:DNA-binding FadR family transcriptional regulator